MSTVVSLLEPAARVAVAALFNSLWEDALLGLAVWAVLAYLPNLNASTRYAAWCVALAAALIMPIATALPQVSVQTIAPSAAVAHRSAAHVLHRARYASEVVRAAAPSQAAAPARPQTAPAGVPLHRPRLRLPQLAALIVFGVWIVVALALLVRLAVNLWRLELLKRDALPLAPDYRDRLPRWIDAEKGGREVRLCVCGGVEVPVAVGLFDSMILLPQHLIETLSQSEIDQITLHELAHLRRADDWSNGLQRIIQSLFFFNPAIIFMAQQLDLEREVACDDWVLRQTGEVRPYASCLTKMAELTAWPHRPLAAPGVFMTRRGLSIRVERLLRAGRNIGTGITLGPAGTIVAALSVLFFLSQTVAPSFAFTQPSSAQTTASAKTPTTKYVYKYVTVAAQRSPVPEATPRIIYIPAVHTHVPARTMRIPAINIDVPARPMVLPEPHLAAVSSGMGAAISRSIGQRVRSEMSQAFASSHAAKERARVAVGNAQCVGCDYSGQDLSGRSFRGEALVGADFSHANLQNADFSRSVLTGVDFSHSNLRGVNFSRAQLSGCDLSGADVMGARFDGASLTGCDVEAHSLNPSQARALLYACRNGCDFSRADLRNQDLRGIRLSGVDLRRADLRGADLSGSALVGVDLSNARVAGARFTNAVLNGCDFDGVDLRNVDLSGTSIVGSKMNDAIMR